MVAAVVVVGAVVTVATAGAAAPLVVGAVASIGLTGAAATVATGVAVGAIAGAAGGLAAGAAGETTRQVVHNETLGLGNEHMDLGRIASEAGKGAVEGAVVGAAIGRAAAFASTAAAIRRNRSGGEGPTRGAAIRRAQRWRGNRARRRSGRPDRRSGADRQAGIGRRSKGAEGSVSARYHSRYARRGCSLSEEEGSARRRNKPFRDWRPAGVMWRLRRGSYATTRGSACRSSANCQLSSPLSFTPRGTGTD